MSDQSSRAARLAALFCCAALLASVAPGGAASETAAPTDPTIGPVTRLPLPRFVSTRSESTNARRGPSLDQRVDWEFVRRGLPLEVTAEYGNWRRVRDADGAGGWVHQTLLSGARMALVVGPEAVALRASPDEASAIEVVAEPGVVARIDACEGGWCEITAGGIDGWLPRGALWGVGPDEVID